MARRVAAGETYDQKFAGTSDDARDNSQRRSDCFVNFSLSRLLLAMDPHPDLPPFTRGKERGDYFRLRSPRNCCRSNFFSLFFASSPVSGDEGGGSRQLHFLSCSPTQRQLLIDQTNRTLRVRPMLARPCAAAGMMRDFDQR